MTSALKLFPIGVPWMAVTLLSACGGDGSGNSGSAVTTYQVSAPGGTGGTISPASATVNAGGTTTLNVTPNSGYVVSGVTGCGGALAGDTYTTGKINAACTVTATFAAAFTWVGGSSTTNASGVYGIQGVTAATNMPGARDGGVTWTDTSGNLWLFGGFSGYAGSQNTAVGNFLNDLWKYSPSSGQWTWVDGSSTVCSQGVYGTRGVAAATNVPGARVAGIRWADASGNLWMFGGGGCDSTDSFVLYDDLWEYSTSSGKWTWVGGSTAAYAPAVYGNEGVPAATNTPGARTAAATWTDATGKVWMFGGYALDSSTSPASGAYLNDLWVYLPSSNEWVWMGGPNTFNAPGVYGTQGTAQAANEPGARSGAVSWTDASGNFWLFGGYGLDSASLLGVLNDVWEYSPSTAQWTWLGGSNTANATGVYGTQGVAAAANVPAARDAAASWTDPSGNVWLFGGEGFDVSTRYFHRFNDFWKYSPSSGAATWIAGSSTFDATGVYGTQGVAAATNVPGARAAAMSWTDASGNLWLFGGYQYDDSTNTRFEMNDLWKYPTQ
jgi:N-acetylneuraminic acid mutarotase